jgi:hypothetical protein
MNLLREPSKQTLQVLLYLGISLCVIMLALGTLAALLNSALIVRIYGGLTAAAALIVGGGMTWQAWFRHHVSRANDESGMFDGSATQLWNR